MQPVLYSWSTRQLVHTFASLVLVSWKHRKNLRNMQDTLDSSPEASTNSYSTGSDLCNTFKWFKFMHKRWLLFLSHCWDNCSSSKQIFQSSPSTPALQERFQVCTVWPARFPSVVPLCPNQRCWGGREGPSAFPATPFKSSPRGAKTLLCKTCRPLKTGCCVKAKYISLSKHQPEGRFCSGKGRKAVADEPVPVPSPAPFYCKSLRINMVKRFKIAFNYLSSTSIMQFSQGTVILPILLSHTLLPMSPESFSFSLPSIPFPPSPLFPLEWKFQEDCNYARALEAVFPGIQGNTASLQVQHWRILSSINGSSDW